MEKKRREKGIQPLKVARGFSSVPALTRVAYVEVMNKYDAWILGKDSRNVYLDELLSRTV